MLPYARIARHRLASAVIAGALMSPMAPTAAAAQTEDAATIVAAEVRAQGYDCEDPVSATRDTDESTADEAVWRLECANATYRVRLTPGMGGKIEEVE